MTSGNPPQDLRQLSTRVNHLHSILDGLQSVVDGIRPPATGSTSSTSQSAAVHNAAPSSPNQPLVWQPRPVPFSQIAHSNVVSNFHTLAPSVAASGSTTHQRAPTPRTFQQPRSTTRRAQTRGTAIQPSSSVAKPNVGACYTTIQYTPGVDTQILRLKVKVYPPQAQPSQLFAYNFLLDSFNRCLESFHLIHRYELPPTTAVTTLVERVVGDMQNSPLRYEFQPSNNSLLSHEVLPLQLLYFMNRGVCSGKDDQVRLRRLPIAGRTLADLTSDRCKFAVPHLCVENDQFVINLVVSRYPFIAKYTSGSGHVRRHTCISSKVYVTFPRDRFDEDVEEFQSSGGEGSESEDTIPTEPNTPTRDIRSTFPARSNDAGAHVEQILSFSGSPTIPPSIWTNEWVPSRDNLPIPLFGFPLPSRAYEAAAHGMASRKLDVRGDSVAELARSLTNMLGDAAEDGDFSTILSPHRDFTITFDNASGFDETRSLGVGIEREVIHAAFYSFQRNAAELALWFVPHADGFSTLATTHSISTAMFLSPTRKRKLSILGALSALLLLHGMAPTPLDPVLLHLFIHDCNLNSIHPRFLIEWHPELHYILKEWIRIGPLGDVAPFQSHFCTYHDSPALAFQQRDEQSHQAIAVDMLCRAIIGKESYHHPELQAFLRGFRLPCRNGFNFFKVAKHHLAGGSETFLSVMWTSHISSFASLQSRLVMSEPPQEFADLLRSATGEDNLTFTQVLVNYLNGSGIPCPGLFADTKPHFDPIIDLTLIDTPGFRSRALCWAATGSPSIGAGEATIAIDFVDDDDDNYAAASTRPSMIAEGKISFRTCFRQAWIPARYVINLARRCYFSSGEPRSLSDAIDHWLLTESLNAIGSHSMI